MVILSDTLRDSEKGAVLRGDSLQPIVRVVYPDKLHTHTITSTTTTTESEYTAADVAARSDLFMFLDFADSSKVTVTSGATGDFLTQINDMVSSTFEFVSSDAGGVPYEDFGTESGKCMNLNGDNIKLSDSTTAAEPTDGTLCMLFSTQTTIDDIQVLTDWYLWRIYVSSSNVAWYDGSSINTTSMTVTAGTDYLLTVRRDAAASSFIWRLEKLSDSSVQTQTTALGSTSSGTGLFDIGGTSSYTADGKISNVVVITSNADTDVENIELYLRQVYRGIGTTTTTTTASQYQLYDPRVTNLNMYQPQDVMRNIELKFEDQDGALFDPEDIVISLEVTPRSDRT